jgi:hypothetical protein
VLRPVSPRRNGSRGTTTPAAAGDDCVWTVIAWYSSFGVLGGKARETRAHRKKLPLGAKKKGEKRNERKT